MTFNKVATFQSNRKKDWFSHKMGLVFVHGKIFKGGSRNFTTIGSSRSFWIFTFFCFKNVNYFQSF